MLNRVLISNRGEIAIRIARAAASLGMESVAIFAAADAAALHTRIADDAREIAADGDPVRAYLDAAAIVAAAQASGCDCVHPGYGFLAENAAFAERCAAAGLTFVGPPPAVLALFGDKVRARGLAQSLAIPVIPGSREPLDSPEQAMALAEIAYPATLKRRPAAGAACAGCPAVTR
ncbi:MAG: biotin carboxylase N-terminal domain-containing protein [Gammaproteobacteria bacterium]|nr:biotin carboxylase N-terminal domain-containing protein [Gammaproteobacteria bacterium]